MLNVTVEKPGLGLDLIKGEGGEPPFYHTKLVGAQIEGPIDETGKHNATDNNSNAN